MTNSSLMSMTGFSLIHVEESNVSIDIQIRGVNSRYLDCVFRLPRIYNSLESNLRSKISQYIGRGKVEVSITRNTIGVSENPIVLNKGRFQEYLRIYRELLTEHGTGSRPEAIDKIIPDILKMSDVWEKSEADQGIPKNEEAAFLKGFEAAVQGFLNSRQVEGAALEKDIRSRLMTVNSNIEDISKLLPTIESIKEKLLQRVNQLKGDFSVDDQRIAQEVVFLADKADSSEEITRFSAHYEQMLLSLKPQSGKKIEFLLQEMMRECNTVASKSSNSRINTLVVETKVELEKIREQLQNVE